MSKSPKNEIYLAFSSYFIIFILFASHYLAEQSMEYGFASYIAYLIGNVISVLLYVLLMLTHSGLHSKLKYKFENRIATSLLLSCFAILIFQFHRDMVGNWSIIITILLSALSFICGFLSASSVFYSLLNKENTQENKGDES